MATKKTSYPFKTLTQSNKLVPTKAAVAWFGTNINHYLKKKQMLPAKQLLHGSRKCNMVSVLVLDKRFFTALFDQGHSSQLTP